MKTLWRAVVVILVTTLCACGDSSSTPSATSIKSIAVVGNTPLLNRESQFEAIATRGDNSTLTVTSQATWQSSNRAVASVDSRGLVSAAGPGTVQISATYSNVVGSITFSVAGIQIAIEGMVVDALTRRPIPGALITASGTLSGTATPDASGRYSMTGAAGLNPNLTVTATAPGYVSVATTVDGTNPLSLVNFLMVRPTPCPTLGFDDLLNLNAPFTLSSTCGFLVQSTTPNWVALTVLGNPPPSIQFSTPDRGPISGEVVVSALNRLPFSFQSMDVYTPDTALPYVLTGTLNSATVFTVQDTEPRAFGADFVTVVNPQRSKVIDSLVIRLIFPGSCCLPNSAIRLDNIKLLQ